MRLITLVAAALCAAALVGGHSTAAGAQTPPPAAEDVEQSRAAVANVDAERLLSDRDYAEGLLGHLDRLEAAQPDDPELRDAIDGLRLFALATAEQHDRIPALLDRVLARRPREADAYGGVFFAVAVTSDWPRLVAAAEVAAQNVPGVGWAELRELLPRELVYGALQEMNAGGQADLRVRLARSLFHIGWPGGGDPHAPDFFRTILLEDRLAHGDTDAAANLAAGLSSHTRILELIVQPRYDAVLEPGRDRLDVLREALAENDRSTQEAASRSEGDHRRILDRAYFLRGVGRNEEAMALLRPFAADVPGTAFASEEGVWLINEAAYSLLALDRGDEAVALMRQLAELPLSEIPELIGPVINYAEILQETGRPAEALEHASRLGREAGDYSNDYGKMWIASAIVCSLQQLDRGAEAASHLARLRENSNVNPGALMKAYLCLGDEGSAADLMVTRLESDDPEDAILALQDYSLSRGPAQTGGAYDRLVALRQRPEVRAALEHVGRVLTLPLARSYWGNF